MPFVEQSIDISAPVEVIFGLIAHEPERMPEWWPPFELQERITAAPTGVGSVSRYVYNMMGVKIKGEHRVESMSENDHLTVKTTSGIDSKFDFTFTPMKGYTRLTIRVDYTLPGSVLGQLLNRAAIEQKNERDLQEGLNHLKEIAEREARTRVM
jgi:uncharacterized membrane protein